MARIEHIQPVHEDTQAISLEQAARRRTRRKKRVAARMHKKYPLFAAQFMQDEFPEVTAAEVVEIMANRKSRKSKRAKKSGLAKYGRYPLFHHHLVQYRLYGKLEDLKEAQRLRKNMAKDFFFDMRCQGEQQTYSLPPTASLAIVKQIASLTFTTWEELESQWAEVTKYGVK